MGGGQRKDLGRDLGVAPRYVDHFLPAATRDLTSHQGEERCFFDGLVGLAKRDRTNTFGTALTTTDPANDLDRVPV